MWNNSKWIWTEQPKKKNSFVRFKVEFNSECEQTVCFRIAAETKYYLYLNDVLTVFDGGLHRESAPDCGYFDELNLSVAKGKNVLTIDVWFWGNGGRNNNAFEQAGLAFECEQLNLYSNQDVQCGVLQAYYEPEGEQPSYLYGGYNIGFNANNDTVEYAAATELANVGDAPYNMPVRRPIPQIRFGENVSCTFEKVGNVYTVKLPYAMQFSPYLKVKANGGEAIDIRSDRYYTNGGPGDSHNVYRGHRFEYVCCAGEQEYSGYNYLFGEKVLFTVPEGVQVLELGYRESGYDCDIVNLPKTNDALLNKLLEKCARTLKVCMRENFMDCPDRERGQWIGDVSVQAPQVFLCLSESAVALLRKALVDFITLRKGDRLVGNVPGDNFMELPSQSLNAISEVGMLAQYYAKTQDTDILKLAFEPIIRYLKLWELGSNGLVIARNGDWKWHDHLYNVDSDVLENCWYYSAVKYALFIADELKDTRFNAFLNERKESIEQNFENAYWNGNFYTSCNFADDRANAMAVLSGLYNKEHTVELRNVLVSVFNSTPYMEGYILEALCILGYKDDAFKRMMSRYYPLIVNENSTVWEDFFTLGTRNHAWSGSPLTIVCKYFPELIVK